MSGTGSGYFSEHVERALHASMEAHAGQTRKGGSIPYITHPMHVALLLARAGADDVTLQAALLHDVVEDCEGWTTARVREEFGSAVARTVEDLTEVEGGSWEVRKQAALDHVAHMCPRSLAVKTADKLHNMHALLARLSEASDPAVVWQVFSRGPGPTIQYARRLADTLTERLAEAGEFELLGRELQVTIDALMSFIPADDA